MGVAQNSEVRFYSDIDVTKNHTLIFSTQAELDKYFEDHRVNREHTAKNKYSYIRRTGELKIAMSIAEAEKIQYLSFINPTPFENKRFYCRVVKEPEIIGFQIPFPSNVNTIRLTYKLDVWMTYMFDFDFGTCIIEREHPTLNQMAYAITRPYDVKRNYFLYTADNFATSPDMYELSLPGIYPKRPPDVTAEDENETAYLMYLTSFDEESIGDINKLYSYFDGIVDESGKHKKYNYLGNATKNPSIPVRFIRGYKLAYIYKNSEKFVVPPEAESGDRYNAEERFQFVQLFLAKAGLASGSTDIRLNTTIVSRRMIDIYLLGKIMYGPIAGIDMYISHPNLQAHDEPRLWVFPNMYIKIQNNNGDTKELKLELFSDLREGRGAYIKYMPIFDNAPSASMIPLNYGVEYNRGDNDPYWFSINDRIDDNAFPQVGLNTDSYYTFYTQQMTSALQQRTTTSETLRSAIMNIGNEAETLGANNPLLSYKGFGENLVNAAGGLIQMGGEGLSALGNMGVSGLDVISGVAGSKDAFSAGMSAINALPGTISNANIMREADNWRPGVSNPSESELSAAKPAYVADYYTPGTSNGVLGFYTGGVNNKGVLRNPGTFSVSLEILDEVNTKIRSEYWKGFGYPSNMFKHPNIEYMLKNDPNEQPLFRNYGGKPVTYVKMKTCEIHAKQQFIEDELSAMFLTGIQFVKGAVNAET